MDSLNKVQYPIGKFEKPAVCTQEMINQGIEDIANFPILLRQEVENLDEKSLLKTYRPNGWTIQQIVHHCADSHINSFTRFKLALTEDSPIIKPYEEALWAELPDTLNYPIHTSLVLLEALHLRWVYLLKSLTPEQLERKFIHPASGSEVILKNAILSYAWHGKHHLAHIKLAKNN